MVYEPKQYFIEYIMYSYDKKTVVQASVANDLVVFNYKRFSSTDNRRKC